MPLTTSNYSAATQNNRMGNLDHPGPLSPFKQDIYLYLYDYLYVHPSVRTFKHLQAILILHIHHQKS